MSFEWRCLLTSAGSPLTLLDLLASADRSMNRLPILRTCTLVGITLFVESTIMLLGIILLTGTLLLGTFP